LGITEFEKIARKHFMDHSAWLPLRQADFSLFFFVTQQLIKSTFLMLVKLSEVE
jgi:hypothetical protein